MFDPDRRLVLAAATGIALIGFAPAAAATDRMLTPAAMQRDIAILYDAYASLHPGLYRYASPATIAARRQTLDRFAATPRSLGAFYLALSAFTASIRCGHSYPNPANQTAAVDAALFDAPDRLPLAFTWLDGRPFVTADLGSGHALPVGSEIVAIDGVDTAVMLARMLPYMRTDGANDARRVADLGVPGDADRPSVDILRSLLFPATGPYARVTVRVAGRVDTVACPLMTRSARDAVLKPRSAGSPYGWRFAVRGRVGVLTMPTWAVFHDRWDWRGFIDAGIDTAIDRDLPGIVVDLRENGGGLDCGAALLARLIAAPLATNL